MYYQVKGDGTLQSEDVGSNPVGFGGHYAGAALVAQDSEGNKYLSQDPSSRCCHYSGISISLDASGCADPPSSSNNKGRYRFSMRYRSNHPQGETGGENGNPYLQMWPGGWNVAGCPKSVDGEWVTCSKEITLSETYVNHANEGSLSLVVSMHATQDKGIDYDDIKFEAIKLPYEIEVADPRAAGCWDEGGDVLVAKTQGYEIGAWGAQEVRRMESADAARGALSFDPADAIGGEPTGLDDDPRMASEVASLSRRVVFDAEVDGPTHDSIPGSAHGGHVIVMHTPNVAQRVEGVELRNFGQQVRARVFVSSGLVFHACHFPSNSADTLLCCLLLPQGNLGRYPVHFHSEFSCARFRAFYSRVKLCPRKTSCHDPSFSQCAAASKEAS